MNTDGICNRASESVTYWTNKVVMITGASSGIGKGMALEIASRGGESRFAGAP